MSLPSFFQFPSPSALRDFYRGSVSLSTSLLLLCRPAGKEMGEDASSAASRIECSFLLESPLLDLLHSYPPEFRNSNKQAIYAHIQSKVGETWAEVGNIGIAKYKWIDKLPSSVELELPEKPLVFLCRSDVYDYESVASTILDSDGELRPTLEFHVNFADQDLFAYYSGSLFAQDEIQAMEHPILGSVRRVLVECAQRLARADSASNSSGQFPFSMFTQCCEISSPEDTNQFVVDRNGNSTPIIITGAPRLCNIDLRPNPECGNLYGLYGNSFARQSPDAVLAAVQVLDPPGLSNLIAMAAPPPGFGVYSLDVIRDILQTTITAFLGARLMSFRHDPSASTIIHSGNWGCGAFGGNKTLLGVLQVLGALIAQIDGFVYHSFDEESRIVIEKAYQIANSLFTEHRRFSSKDGDSEIVLVDLDEIARNLHNRSFTYGVSDGN